MAGTVESWGPAAAQRLVPVHCRPYTLLLLSYDFGYELSL